MGPLRLALYPLSLLYGAIVRTRNLLYDRGILSVYESPIPVVSVGNVTAGGNAKTPLCIYLAEQLAAKGMRPVILSRGYRGRLKGPHLVSTTDRYEDVGDEPLLMSRLLSGSVVVARDRVAGAKFIEERKLGDVIILDDGLQHRRLARSVDIITVFAGSDEAVADFVSGALLPLGRFREPREKGLRRAQIVVLSERKMVRERQLVDTRLLHCMPEAVQLYRSFLDEPRIVSLADYAAGNREKQQDLAKLKEVIVLCGLAHPEGFLSTLNALGMKVIAQRCRADHYPLSASDVTEFQSEYPQIPIVCTEKDAVKLDPNACSGVFVLCVKLHVTPADAFLVQVRKRLLKN